MSLFFSSTLDPDVISTERTVSLHGKVRIDVFPPESEEEEEEPKEECLDVVVDFLQTPTGKGSGPFGVDGSLPGRHQPGPLLDEIRPDQV